jgi:integrase
MVMVKAIIKTESAVDPRPKNFLTEAEMGNFLKAARKGRHALRNFVMLLMAFRHGLRVSELVNMRMTDVDLDTGRLFVRRLKGSLSTSQPLEGDEIRALRAWLRERIKAPCCNSPLVFLSERGPMTRQAFNYICAVTAVHVTAAKFRYDHAVIAIPQIIVPPHLWVPAPPPAVPLKRCFTWENRITSSQARFCTKARKNAAYLSATRQQNFGSIC